MRERAALRIPRKTYAPFVTSPLSRPSLGPQMGDGLHLPASASPSDGPLLLGDAPRNQQARSMPVDRLETRRLTS